MLPASCGRRKEKLWSVNDFHFTTLQRDKYHLVSLNRIKSNFVPYSTGWWEIQCPQGLPRSPMGRGWQRLPGSWKSTAQHSVGPGVLAEAGPRPLVALSSEAQLYHPSWALQETLVSTTLGTTSCTSWLISFPRGMGTVPRVHYFP